jgi:hypothetical protein
MTALRQTGWSSSARKRCIVLIAGTAAACAPSGANAASHIAASQRAHIAASHSRQQTKTLKMMWGPATLPSGASAFPVYQRLGVKVLEVQLSWAQTTSSRPGDPANPADPAYHWPAALDAATSQAAQYGISIAVMVKGTPPWANSGKDQSWAPNDPGDYANFLRAASRHYSTVHDWMIWGEVTRQGNFNPMPANSPVGPRRYALLLDAAYGALKAVSPANVVIGGMTFTVGQVSAPAFIRWMRLPDGAPPRLDYYGHNPYSTRFPDLAEKPYASGVRDINDIDTLHSELAGAYRGRGATPRLWLSEFGISSDGSNRAFDYFVSRAAQARWVSAAYKLASSVPYVAGLGWYELLDEPASVAGHLTEGLLTAGGAPKPAFAAYQRAP